MCVSSVFMETFPQQSIFNMIPTEDQKNLPEDENTPEKRAEKVWEFFGKKENGKSGGSLGAPRSHDLTSASRLRR